MKSKHFIILIALFFCSIACANKNNNETVNNTIIKDTIVAKVDVADTFETGKVISKVICKTDVSQSYALYIPVKSNKEAFPVVYFFDPHGDGSLPLNKYKALADVYSFILIGSNNSKNGNDWLTDEHIWATLFDDSQKRLKIISNRIYTCGFSGGAKVATYIALHHNQIKGVIANGAGLPDITSAGNFKFSFTAIAGEGDMNMTDLVAITNGLDQTQTRHRIIFFNGIHEWAPEGIMNIAFAGLQFDAMHKKTIEPNKVFINEYIAGSKKRIADHVQTKNYVKEERECRLSTSMLDGLTNDVTWFIKKDAEVKNSAAYQKQWQAAQTLLQTEANIKSIYDQQFQRGDKNYWVKTINDVQSRSKAPTAEGAMYQRLHAYLSLAFYSISNQLINAKQDTDARYFVDLYKLSDAANSEAWYFSAVLNARSKDSKATKNDLMKAIALGFADKNRMMEQTEFQNMGIPINLNEIESKMK